jgi:hypothetical protein
VGWASGTKEAGSGAPFSKWGASVVLLSRGQASVDWWHEGRSKGFGALLVSLPADIDPHGERTPHVQFRRNPAVCRGHRSA